MILSLNTEVTLEKHSGRTLNDIICGFSIKETSKLTKGFLSEYVNFFLGKNKYDIPLPLFYKNSYYRKKIITNDNGNSYIKFKELTEYLRSIFMVDNDRILIYPEANTDDKIKISHFINSTLSTELNTSLTFFGSFNDRKFPEYSNAIKACFADPHYIVWCIANLENFAIDEEAIEKEYELSSLLKMEIIPINHEDNDTRMHILTKYGGFWFDQSNSVICKPVLVNTKYRFGDRIKKINYEHLINLERKALQKHSNFYYNERNWLRDAAGTDDPETMNDAYWNMD